MRRVISFLSVLSIGALLLLLLSCRSAYAEITPLPLQASYDVAVKWAKMSTDVIENSPSNTPTYSSRALAYMGVTMYESVVHSNSGYRSLVGQINGLTQLPKPNSSQIYSWPLVLNAAQAFMLYKLYPHAYRYTALRIDSLQRAISTEYSVFEKQDVVERSVTYGWALGTAIFDWSKTDGGYEGYSRNFDMTYQVPIGPSYWVSPIGGQSASSFPLHPTWGNNRTFIPANSQLPLPELPAYSAVPGSAYYREHEAVYRKNAMLTEEEKAIALWWADDPLHSSAPPGHSYNIATTVVKIIKPDLVKAAETYARVGMAVADAFINCWKCKYAYHRERPSTFISTNIRPGWKPFWPEPPFPAFSSGHSTQAAAAATVLTSLYGKHIELTDSTHYGHLPDLVTGVIYKPRHFKTFWQMAVECADSRFYGGIHTQLDNQVGLMEGKKIGKNINELVWHN